MPSTPTSSNRFEKQGTGENANTWGSRLNDNTIELIDDAIDGLAAYALSGAKTLVSTNYAADEARMAIQHITSGTGGTVTIPGVHKWYLVKNTSSGTVTFTTGAGTTGVVAAGDQRIVVCDGTNVYNLRALNYGAELPVSTGTPTLSTQMATKGYVDGISFSSSLPGQAGQAGKFITTDGTTASWATITKSTVGLANVDNTADTAKPVSTAQQTALNLKANNTISISAGTGLLGGGNLTADRTITPDIATQAEAEARTSATKMMTPQRTGQAIAAHIATTSVQFIIDGGGGVITAGVKGDIQVPFACTVTGWTVLGDVSGSVEVEVWKDTYTNFPPVAADKISGTENPKLITQAKNTDTALTTWSTLAIAANDVLRFNVIGTPATVTRITVIIHVSRT